MWFVILKKQKNSNFLNKKFFESVFESRKVLRTLTYRVRINYRRISLRSCRLHTVNVTFGQGQCLRPTTSKDTTRIARAHQHRNRERHTRHA
jgi:hypothetical protein